MAEKTVLAAIPAEVVLIKLRLSMGVLVASDYILAEITKYPFFLPKDIYRRPFSLLKAFQEATYCRRLSESKSKRYSDYELITNHTGVVYVFWES
tara:strand:+ start:4473 stop:4757 length:285 start_codon:yes stop_codon:yes gene_type:complete